MGVPASVATVLIATGLGVFANLSDLQTGNEVGTKKVDSTNVIASTIFAAAAVLSVSYLVYAERRGR